MMIPFEVVKNSRICPKNKINLPFNQPKNGRKDTCKMIPKRYKISDTKLVNCMMTRNKREGKSHLVHNNDHNLCQVEVEENIDI